VKDAQGAPTQVLQHNRHTAAYSRRSKKRCLASASLVTFKTPLVSFAF